MTFEYAKELWSRAYYASFHAVSAMFAMQHKNFSKHTAVKAAVHRDLVNTGKWPKELGEAAHRILKAIEKIYPEIGSTNLT